jgi:hypothetical protein
LAFTERLTCDGCVVPRAASPFRDRVHQPKLVHPPPSRTSAIGSASHKRRRRPRSSAVLRHGGPLRRLPHQRVALKSKLMRTDPAEADHGPAPWFLTTLPACATGASGSLLHLPSDPGVHRVSTLMTSRARAAWGCPRRCPTLQSVSLHHRPPHVTVLRNPLVVRSLRAARPRGFPVLESVVPPGRCRTGGLDALLGFPCSLRCRPPREVASARPGWDATRPARGCAHRARRPAFGPSSPKGGLASSRIRTSARFATRRRERSSCTRTFVRASHTGLPTTASWCAGRIRRCDPPRPPERTGREALRARPEGGAAEGIAAV